MSTGCHKAKQPLRAAEIHAITRELAAASSGAANSEVHSDLAASDEDADSRDRLNITLRVDAADASGRSAVSKLLQSLGRVATRHGLTQDAQSESREGISFSYSRGGHATHTIHIHLAVVAAGQGIPQGSTGRARLAIILDDLGTDRAPADAIFALPYPLTISVLPNRPHSVDIAETASSRGYQVMLHLPMESVSNGTPESQELRPGMSAREVSTLVSQFVSAVPGVTGVNNHQGSQSTADPALMNELMNMLRDRNLFYIDSRTTAATVAYDAARRAGVRSAFRNVPFLDDVPDLSAVQKQLRLALRGAKEKGEAIAIGHPHRATLAALKEVLPQAKTEGVQLVFASDLVH
jgi:polysaccharide deacetylase 2 family uncharacterized protein YibQ